MAVTVNSVVDPITPRSYATQFTVGSSAGIFSPLLAGGVNGTKVMSLYATNSSTIAKAITIAIKRSSSFLGALVTVIPTLAGVSTGIPPINLFNPSIWPGFPVDSDGNPFFFLSSTADTLEYGFGGSSITAGVLVLAGNAMDF